MEVHDIHSQPSLTLQEMDVMMDFSQEGKIISEEKKEYMGSVNSSKLSVTSYQNGRNTNCSGVQLKVGSNKNYKKEKESGKLVNLSDSFVDYYEDISNIKIGAVNDTVKTSKKKEDRKNMHGYECPCCQHYYAALNLSPKSRQKRIDAVSRHRTVDVKLRPKSPEHFWSLSFPSTQECIDRGYLKPSKSAKESMLRRKQ